MGTFERKSRKCLLSVFIMCYNLWQNTLTKKKKKIGYSGFTFILDYQTLSQLSTDSVLMAQRCCVQHQRVQRVGQRALLLMDVVSALPPSLSFRLLCPSCTTCHLRLLVSLLGFSSLTLEPFCLCAWQGLLRILHGPQDSPLQWLTTVGGSFSNFFMCPSRPCPATLMSRTELDDSLWHIFLTNFFGLLPFKFPFPLSLISFSWNTSD